MNPLMMMALGAANASSSGNGQALNDLFSQIMAGGAQRTGPQQSPLTGMQGVPLELLRPAPRQTYTPPKPATQQNGWDNDAAAGAVLDHVKQLQASRVGTTAETMRDSELSGQPKRSITSPLTGPMDTFDPNHRMLLQLMGLGL